MDREEDIGGRLVHGTSMVDRIRAIYKYMLWMRLGTWATRGEHTCGVAGSIEEGGLRLFGPLSAGLDGY